MSLNLFLIGCLAVLLCSMAQARAQKITIGGNMGMAGSNLLQVQGENGFPAIISYNYHYHKSGSVTHAGQEYYPMMHDEMRYNRVTNVLMISHDVYQLQMNGEKSTRISGREISIDIESLEADAPLKKAIDSLLSMISREAGITGKKGRSLAVVPTKNTAIDNQIKQIENLAPAKR